MTRYALLTAVALGVWGLIALLAIRILALVVRALRRKTLHSVVLGANTTLDTNLLPVARRHIVDPQPVPIFLAGLNEMILSIGKAGSRNKKHLTEVYL